MTNFIFSNSKTFVLFRWETSRTLPFTDTPAQEVWLSWLRALPLQTKFFCAWGRVAKSWHLTMAWLIHLQFSKSESTSYKMPCYLTTSPLFDQIIDHRNETRALHQHYRQQLTSSECKLDRWTDILSKKTPGKIKPFRQEKFNLMIFSVNVVAAGPLNIEIYNHMESRWIEIDSQVTVRFPEKSELSLPSY